MKKQIAVIFRGCSPEYGVSLQSAYAVASNMDLEQYEPILVGITRQGDWYRYTGPLKDIAEDTWHRGPGLVPAAISPDRSTHGLLIFDKTGVKKINLHGAFPVLHGKNGEDGTVQGALQLAGIPIVGCGVLSSALCMDKDRAHRLARAAGISVPRSFTIEKGDGIKDAEEQAEGMGYPLFVKPVRAGSSFGVTKAASHRELSAAIKTAFAFDDRVIVEEAVSGFEVGCAILGTDPLTVGEVDEIELADGFFDFAEKYTLKTSSIHVPARIPAETAERVKVAAKKIYRALDCRGFARVDLFLSDSGELFFNEVNTIPGFTDHSRFPNMLKAAGLSFRQVVNIAIEQAVAE